MGPQCLLWMCDSLRVLVMGLALHRTSSPRLLPYKGLGVLSHFRQATQWSHMVLTIVRADTRRRPLTLALFNQVLCFICGFIPEERGRWALSVNDGAQLISLGSQ